ncbi:PRC-barrel domain protein [Sulfitobacter noctilucae]|uniref:PRC-barrel domain-containing protein n=1 Tax=Sulfitobacter noctilucae TaxID=1342302 RepID=UPI00046AE3AC|nr:PRC-barrel domain-containing protein [Sulfitobacter noctilucae]KIN75205.1 PRC-barrel domain protein [Sulfitobacter noctilucae]
MLIRTSLIVALMGGAAFAEDTKNPVESKDAQRQDGNYLRALDDMEVHDAAGEKIGEVEDVLIDGDGMPVAYVVEIGGLLGIGSDEAIVPIDAFEFAGGAYVSKMTQDQLENLPRWDD